MTAAESSVLSKKVKCSNLDISAYPQLEDFTNFFNYAVEQVLAETSRTAVGRIEGRATIAEGDAALALFPQYSVNYEIPASVEEETVLISLAPGFVVSLAESLLGAEFVLNAESSHPSPANIQLAQPFVAELDRKLNVYFTNNQLAAGRQLLGTPNAVSSAADGVKKSGESKFYFSICVNVKQESGDSIQIVTALFPIKVLEHIGLLEQRRKVFQHSESNQRWRSMMESNINGLEVELPVVLTKFKSLLSDLSRIDVGEIIPLEENAHNELDITLQTKQGVLTIGKARLGAFKRYKAVKLTTDLGVCD